MSNKHVKKDPLNDLVKPTKEQVDTEQQIIYLLLNHTDVIDEFIRDGIKPDFFSTGHDLVVDTIYKEYLSSDRKHLLSIESFEKHLHRIKEFQEHKGKIVPALNLFAECESSGAPKSMLGHLKRKLVDLYTAREVTPLISQYREDVKNLGHYEATKLLTQGLDTTTRLGSSSILEWSTLDSVKDGHMGRIKHLRENPEDVVLCHIPEIDDVMTVGFKPMQMTLFVADVGGHKCLPGHVKCHLSSGEEIKVCELFRQHGDKILSINDFSRELFYQDILRVHTNGVKECFKVRTQMGFEVESTSNHPYLTMSGYKNLSDLRVGDHVAIVSKTNFGTKSVSEALSTWLGCMYSDGGTSSPSYTFTNGDPSIVNALKKSCSFLGGNLVPACDKSSACYRENSFRPNGTRSFGMEFGIDGKTALEKKLHPEIYTWNRHSLVDFLRAMYGCDGCFSKTEQSRNGKTHTRYSIVYSSSSKPLAEGVRSLLIKFGLVAKLSKIKVKYKGEYRDSWQVVLRDCKQICSFINQIGFLGRKDKIAQSCLHDIKSKKSNRNTDTIPADVWSIIDAEFSRTNKTHYSCRKALKVGGTDKKTEEGHCGTRGKSINKYILSKIAQYLDSDILQSLANAQVVWDKITEIESSGLHETYNIEMPGHHNFVANHFITHNSNMMINVALNIFDKHDSNVLFVSLEMPKEDVINRIIANRVGIPFYKLAIPSRMTDEEVQKIESSRIWDDMKHKFAILDTTDRVSPNQLDSVIQDKILYFKPSVIFIDYVAIMKGDRDWSRQSSIPQYMEVGEILKNLRFMGKKYGFHIVSAAQMNRSTLNRMRAEGPSATPDSTALRGSHDYSADAENIFALLKNEGEPDKLGLFTIKSRGGASGQVQSLRVDPAYCRISSESAREVLVNSDQFDEDGLEEELNRDPSEIAQEYFKSTDHSNLMIDDLSLDGVEVEGEDFDIG